MFTVGMKVRIDPDIQHFDGCVGNQHEDIKFLQKEQYIGVIEDCTVYVSGDDRENDVPGYEVLFSERFDDRYCLSDEWFIFREGELIEVKE